MDAILDVVELHRTAPVDQHRRSTGSSGSPGSERVFALINKHLQKVSYHCVYRPQEVLFD